MFTGIVEERGEVLALERADDSARIVLRAPLVAGGLAPGDSVAVNGVCLTAVDCGDGRFSADVTAETLERSSLGGLAAGDPVNLERPVTPTGRLGGHLVQGHVDDTGTVLAPAPALRVSLPDGLARYVVAKGSITVDGVSLTVSALGPDWFEVALIPTTVAVTTLGTAAVGAPVNLEVDLLAKYVEKLLEAGAR